MLAKCDAQGRPFGLGEDVVDPDVVRKQEAFTASAQASQALTATLPNVFPTIGMSSLVWIGLIYWLLIRR